jgi:hypothetical protein
MEHPEFGGDSILPQRAKHDRDVAGEIALQASFGQGVRPAAHGGVAVHELAARRVAEHDHDRFRPGSGGRSQLVEQAVHGAERTDRRGPERGIAALPALDFPVQGAVRDVGRRLASTSDRN